MSSWITFLNLVAAEWAGAIGRACWQGSLAIVLVWALCRALPRLSGRVQCWLWRLVYLKLLVALLWGVPLCLPLLPAERVPPSAALGSGLWALGPNQVQPRTVVPHGSPGNSGSAAEPRARTTASRRCPPEPRTAPKALAAWLLLLWLLGASGVAIQVLADWRRTQRLRTWGTRVQEESLLAECRTLSRRLQVRQEPVLLTADDLSCPVLVGVARPAVVLPSSFPAEFTPAQMRLMLAHELAHLKRRDLLWAWLPSLARVLFFFHPLVWLAEGEWRLAQEMACDEQVVLSTGTSQARYGAMLLEVMGEPRRTFPASLLTAGVAESYATIRRRLVAIQHVRAVSRRRWSLVGLALAATGTVATLPWRLTARPAVTQPQIASGQITFRAEEVDLRPGPSERKSPLPLADETRRARQERLHRAPRLLAQARLAPAASPHPHPLRPSARPENSRPEPAKRRGGETARRRDGEAATPSLRSAGSGPDEHSDVLAVSPPVPVAPGLSDVSIEVSPEKPLATVIPFRKAPYPSLLVGKPGDEELARMKKRAFEQRISADDLLMLPKAPAVASSRLGWRPSPLLLGRSKGLDPQTAPSIDPRDLRKRLAQASLEGVIEPKLAAQLREIDPALLKKLLAQARSEADRDGWVAEEKQRRAIQRSLEKAERREMLDSKLFAEKRMMEKEQLHAKWLDQAKRPPKKEGAMEILDGEWKDGIAPDLR